MTLRLIAATVVAFALSTPVAGAYGRSDCDYTASQEHSHREGDIVVYADTDGDGGHTGTADLVVGVCAVDSEGTPFSDPRSGGSAEAGFGNGRGNSYGTTTESIPGIYVIATGGSSNPQPADGYAGVSNYESDGAGSGSNSGGNVGPSDGETIVNFVPLACGRTTGNWESSGRDGCAPS